MCSLIYPDHSVAHDGWEFDWRIVEDPFNEVGDVVHQHTPICGRKYVVSKYPMKNLDNGLTLLVGQTILLSNELVA